MWWSYTSCSPCVLPSAADILYIKVNGSLVRCSPLISRHLCFALFCGGGDLVKLRTRVPYMRNFIRTQFCAIYGQLSGEHARMRRWGGCGELPLEMDNLIMKRTRSKEPQMRRSYNISSWRSSDIPSCSLSQIYRYSLYENFDFSLCAPSRSLPLQQAARRDPQR